jgi:outer membrane receptor protein involved in Fe transport
MASLAATTPQLAPGAIDEIIVTAQRRQQAKLDHAGNIERLGRLEIRETAHQHISELLNRVAGVWVVRGGGQENLTAIRSPVLAGAGSCAGFLLMEDGIPVRPSGFCNVNQFLELNGGQADAVEVIRGPGNALFGSNALHGIVNVLMPYPGMQRPELSVEWGANRFRRVAAALPFDTASSWLGMLTFTDDGGFREDSGYRQSKVHFKRQGRFAGGEFTAAFSATRLDQETAGFIYGEDAYLDPALRLTNPDPDAFRDARSERLYGHWRRSLGELELDVRPYLRHSRMSFLHHFRPGLPLEKNGQTSAGVLGTVSMSKGRSRWVTGLDAEWSDVFLKQTQFEPARGSTRVRETFPVGRHYDYEVGSVSLAAFVQADFEPAERWSLGAGLRAEVIRYDYDNLMLDGSTREDGSECGFGGCIYSRPADRSDSFTNLAPKLSATYSLNDQTRLYAALSRGFRAPQMTELYRLQSGQQVSDLDSEYLDHFELGLRSRKTSWSGDFVVYAMRKRDSVFRDASGFNVSGGRTRHHGLEVSLDWRLATDWQLSLDASLARHRYDFTFTPARGEQFIKGRDVDTAPRRLGSFDIQYAPGSRWRFNLQWIHTGRYFLDAENRFVYPGHTLANLRAGVELGERYSLRFRLNNLGDRLVADRADYAQGQYRYFPARGRELFIEIRYTPL